MTSPDSHGGGMSGGSEGPHRPSFDSLEIAAGAAAISPATNTRLGVAAFRLQQTGEAIETNLRLHESLLWQVGKNACKARVQSAWEATEPLRALRHDRRVKVAGATGAFALTQSAGFLRLATAGSTWVSLKLGGSAEGIVAAGITAGLGYRYWNRISGRTTAWSLEQFPHAFERFKEKRPKIASVGTKLIGYENEADEEDAQNGRARKLGRAAYHGLTVFTSGIAPYALAVTARRETHQDRKDILHRSANRSGYVAWGVFTGVAGLATAYPEQAEWLQEKVVDPTYLIPASAALMVAPYTKQIACSAVRKTRNHVRKSGKPEPAVK